MPSPFPMAQDLPPSNEDRISHLEATIDDLRSQGEATKSMLQAILDKLGAPAPNLVPPPALNPVTSPALSHPGPEPNTPLSPISIFNTPSTGRKRPVLKASVPGDFTGDRTKGKAFLSSCWTYMHLCSEAFPDDTTRIIWALSFMKSDQAYRWAQRALDFEVRVGALQFQPLLLYLYMNTWVFPKSLHKSTPGIPHHPKKKDFAVMPGLVRISNRVLWVSG